MTKKYDIRYNLFKEHNFLPKEVRIELKVVSEEETGIRNAYLNQSSPFARLVWLIYIDGQKHPAKETCYYDLGSIDKAFAMAYLEHVGIDHNEILKKTKDL